MSVDGKPTPPNPRTPFIGVPSLLRGFDRSPAHELTAEQIDRLVKKGAAGRFAIGYRDARGAFRIQQVGYAPFDLNAELKARLGTSRHFKFHIESLPPGPAMESASRA